jgi:phage shock protein B
MVVMIPLIAVAGGILIGLIKVMKGGSPESRDLNAEEARLIQDIHRSMVKMEERVEALETLLLERGGDRAKR